MNHQKKDFDEVDDETAISSPTNQEAEEKTNILQMYLKSLIEDTI